MKSTDRRGSKKEPSAEPPHVYNVFLTVHAPKGCAPLFLLARVARTQGVQKKQQPKGAQCESSVETHSNLNLLLMPRPKGAASKSCPERKRLPIYMHICQSRTTRTEYTHIYSDIYIYIYIHYMKRFYAKKLVFSHLTFSVEFPISFQEFSLRCTHCRRRPLSSPSKAMVLQIASLQFK